jgi:hypothetical protein
MDERKVGSRPHPQPQPRPRPKRASRRSLRVSAAGSAAVAFALPWLALRAAPHPPTAPPRVVVVQANGKVVSGHTVSPGGSPSVTTTRASGTAPVH